MKILLATNQIEQGFLRVQGPEADVFLQGQLSCDLRQVTPDQGLIGSYSSPKGRMLAVMQLLREDSGAVLIEIHRSILEATLKRLRLFVLRSRLTIADVSGEVTALGLIGTGAGDWLRAQSLPVPENPQTCARQDAMIVLRRLGALPRYSLIASPDRIEHLRTKLPDGAWQADPVLWRGSEIDAGIPVVYPETRERHVPQMANLDLLGGVAFDKGCYTGQEIVARLHYLGQLKRRLFVARIAGNPPRPGDPVQAAGDAQAAGEIVDAVAGEDGWSRATLVLQLGHRDAPLTLADGRTVTLVSGPTA